MVDKRKFDAEKIVAEYRSGKISRREFGRIAAAVGVAGVATSLAPGAVNAADQPMVFTWAGYDDMNLYPGYAEKYGGEPRFTLWGDEEEGITKMVSGFQADLIFPCSYKIRKWNEAGVIQPIDTSRLKNWSDVLPSLQTMPGVVQGGNVVWIPIDWGQTSVLFRRDLAPEYVNNGSWSILWDQKFQGRIGFFDSLVDGVAIAGIMAGLENPYDYRKQSDLDATREKLKSLMPNLRYFSNDITTMEQGIASGELVAATLWNDSYVRLRNDGLDVEYMNPKESGPMTWVCGFALCAGAEHEDQAYALIDAMLSPESRAYELREFGFGGSTQGGFDAVTDEELASLGYSRDVDAVLAAGSFQEEIQNESALQAMFDEVKAGL